MPYPTLPAVDELADLRRTLAQLRQRELELCDEIRACASETGAARVEGDTRMAMIETRAPRLLDMSKLPSEILNAPEMFSATPQTYVLLWPKSSSAAPSDADIPATASPDVSALEASSHDSAIDDPEVNDLTQSEASLPLTDIPEDTPQPRLESSPIAHMGDAFEDAQTEVSPSMTAQDMTAQGDIDAETDDTITDMAEPSSEIAAQVDNGPAPLDAPTFDISDTAQADANLEVAESLEPPMPDAPNMAEQTVDHDLTAPETPIFDIAGDDAPSPALDMPALDVHEIAETAEETPAPADLRATQYTDLQPMGDLTDEDLEAAFLAAEQDLPPAVDPEAVLSTEALQAEFDTRVDAPETLENDEPAPFVTRRVIGAPA